MLHEPLMAELAGMPGWAQAALRALAVLLVGYVAMVVVRAYAGKIMARSPHIDPTLRGFLVAVITTGGWLLLVAAVLGAAGVHLGALLGGLAVGGFIVGFALKDVLGNLAAGVMLLFYRPFNVGDLVTVAGHDGTVRTLGMSLAVIQMADGRLVTVPNGGILGAPIVNHTRHPVRRFDLKVGIGYGDDVGKALVVLVEALRSDPRVLRDPGPEALVAGLGPSTVDLVGRAWLRVQDYSRAPSALWKATKQAFDKEGISIPFPTQEVLVVQK